MEELAAAIRPILGWPTGFDPVAAGIDLGKGQPMGGFKLDDGTRAYYGVELVL